MSTLKPEVVVVTGASAGIGRATVREFAKQGAHIGLIARNVEALENARREVEEAGGKAVVAPADVSDPDQVEAAAAKIEEELGPIDIWVNNAMASILSPFKEIKPEEFRRVTEVTYLGYVYGTMAALRRMLPRDRGKIVQVGSGLAYRSIPLQSAYCGAKAAIRGFTDSLRTELLHEGSNVGLTMVQLAAFNTPQFGWIKNKMPHQPQPVPPIYQPEVAAEAITWAAYNDRRELWVGMSTVKAILANKVAPGLLDHYLAKTGYDSQQTDELVNPYRQNNLWDTVPGDRGAHGKFDDRARDESPQLWAAENQGLLTAAGLSLAGVALAAFLGSKDRSESSKTQEIDERPITVPEMGREMINQLNRTSKADKFNLLMGLAVMGMKAFAGKPGETKKVT
jgi:NAD(P)-dependent dehydrogenase (short-subunit alcohol dehydrogenase family)